MKTCPACKKENAEIAIHCETCGYPFEGTEQEKAIHIGKFISKKGVKYDKDDSLIRSQKILGFIALANLLLLLGTYSILDPVSMSFEIFIVVVFGYCALTIHKHSVIKIIIPLSIMVLSTTILALISINLFLTAILIRLVYIAVLVYSLITVRAHQKFIKKYES